MEGEICSPPFLEHYLENKYVYNELSAYRKVCLFGTKYGNEKPLFNICYVIQLKPCDCQNLEKCECKRAGEETVNIGIERSQKKVTLYLKDKDPVFISKYLFFICLASYNSGWFKSDQIIEKESIFTCQNRKILQLNLYHDHSLIANKQIFDYWICLARNLIYVRNLENQPAIVANPEWMQKQAEALIFQNKEVLTMESIIGKDLEKNQMNLIYSTGLGCFYSPRLLNIIYKGNPSSLEIYSIIGKGITFDTGGINLKGSGCIEDRYLDKGGACAILGVIKGVCELKLKVNIVASIIIAENCIDANSYKPGDVIKSKEGLTVEITNTTSEGRCVIADTISYVKNKYNPTTIIDMATVSCAINIALGQDIAGIFSNDELLSSELYLAGKEVYENLWKMPILEGHELCTKGDLGDLSNLTPSNYSGNSCVAAAFLKKFVGNKVKWAHLDISGVAIRMCGKGIINRGGTGFGVNTLINFFKKKSQ